MGLRTRLAVTIAAIVLVAAAATFATVYRGTGSRVRDQIERDLSTEVDSLASRLAERGPAGRGSDPSPGAPLDRVGARIRAILEASCAGRTGGRHRH